MQTDLEGSESQAYGPSLYGLFEKAQIDGVPLASSLFQYLNVTQWDCLIYFLSPSYHLLLWSSRAGKIRIHPKAAGAWPIIGHLLLGSQLPGIFFYKITVNLKLIF